MKSKISSYTLLLGALLILALGCRKEDDKPPDPVSDIEGNTYKTVKTGTQVWMAENLKTTRYNDGTDIALVTNTEVWSNLATPGYCWYNNDEAANKDTYGALYNGHTVSTGKLCPTGWHVPIREEWLQLRDFLGDTLTGGGKLKEAGTTHWLAPNKGADNSSGFTSLAAGIRYLEGSYKTILYFTCIWSATETGTNDEWYLSLYFGDAIAKMSHISKKHGFSVRCIKD
ncbi:MAG: fibrobacter succinogenes major paralogous domain-containing protein [Bacteroidia bacterium]|nr:fibrobacter succinogenes major paralogous domain-containing protein [Bacteroidia bacterium]